MSKKRILPFFSSWSLVFRNIRMKKIGRGNFEKSGFLKKNEKSAKNRIYCEFFCAFFSCYFEFSVQDGNILWNKSIIGAVQTYGPVRTLLKKKGWMGVIQSINKYN